jgi:hypothetical protein
MEYMFDVIHKFKRECILFATVRLDGDHSVYLSAYGEMASALLERYVEGQRADNEELFAEWDKSLQEVSSQPGFEVCHEVEDGYVYISTFQSGIGIPSEDEAGPKRRIVKREPETSLLRSDLGEEQDEGENEQ